MLPALVIFIATYVVLVGAELPFLRLDRTGAALTGAAAMVAFGVLSPAQVYREAVNWDTIVLLLGTLAGTLTPVASVANLIVLELAGTKGKIRFLRFFWLGALCTFLPLVLALATLLVEQWLQFFEILPPLRR